MPTIFAKITTFQNVYSTLYIDMHGNGNCLTILADFNSLLLRLVLPETCKIASDFRSANLLIAGSGREM